MSFVSLKENKNRMLIAQLPHRVAELPGLVTAPRFPAIINAFAFETNPRPIFVEIISAFAFEGTQVPVFVEITNAFAFEE